MLYQGIRERLKINMFEIIYQSNVFHVTKMDRANSRVIPQRTDLKLIKML